MRNDGFAHLSILVWNSDVLPINYLAIVYHFSKELIHQVDTSLFHSAVFRSLDYFHKTKTNGGVSGNGSDAFLFEKYSVEN